MSHPLKGLLYAALVEIDSHALSVPMARANFRAWDVVGMDPMTFVVALSTRDGCPSPLRAELVYSPWCKRGYVYFKSQRWDYSGPTPRDVVMHWFAAMRARERSER